MKIRKWLMTAVMLGGMTAALLPGVPASAASVPTDGTGTVIENTTADSSSREFFTIKTADGNVFYIVVDKTKTDDNVYLLTPVTEDSLKALAESAAQKNGAATVSGASNLFGGQSASSQSSETTGAAAASSTTGNGTSNAAKTQTAKNAASVGNIAFIVLVAILVFAAAFYFKIYKPKHAPVPESFDEEPDEDDSGEDGGEDNDKDEESPRRSAPTQKTSAQPEPEEESEPEPREPRVPAAPRPRREDVRQENEDSADEPEADTAQPEPSRPVQVSAHVRVGGLFAPDAQSTPDREQENVPQASRAGDAEKSEEPEPEEDETEMDYGDGMDAFGNPDKED